MRKYSNNIFILFILMLSMKVTSQERIIVSGNIKDSKGETLPSVVITEFDKNTRIVASSISDINGNFSFSVKNINDSLRFSLIGYTSETAPITVSQKINVVLNEESILMNEVKIIAQKTISVGNSDLDPRRVTQAIKVIDSKEFEGTSAASVEELLVGRVSGVDFVSSSGDPGAGMNIRVRGSTSINANSSPLIVLDGSPYETQIGSFNFQSADDKDYAALLSISVADIESITFLLDASSTAQYGTRAAGGILMITTKKGQKGKVTVNYGFKNSIDYQPVVMPLLSGDDYGKVIQDGFLNLENNVNPIYQDFFTFDKSRPYYYYNFQNNTDWRKEVTQLGLKNEHNLAISGGGEKSQYRISTGYYNQKGTVVGTSYDRLNTRFNLTYKVSTNLSVQSNFEYSHGITNSPKNATNYDISQSRINGKTALQLATIKDPRVPIYEINEDGTTTGRYFNARSSDIGYQQRNLGNPVALAKEGLGEETNDKLRSLFSVEDRIFSNAEMSLKYVGNLVIDITNIKINNFLPQSVTGAFYNETATTSNYNEAFKANTEKYSVENSHYLVFNYNLSENSKLLTFAKMNVLESRSTNMQEKKYYMPSENFSDPIVTGYNNNEQTSAQFFRQRIASFVGGLNYQFMKILTLDATFNRESNSRFGKNNKAAIFPTLGGNIILNELPKIKEISFLSELKVRGSIGNSGNQPTGNSILPTYNSVGSFLGVNGVSVSNIELKSLQWEKIFSQNYGGTLSLFNNRLTVDVDYYIKEVSGLLLRDLSLPLSSGYANLAWINSSDMQNKGVDVTTKISILKNKNGLNWDFAANISRNVNIITKISDKMNTSSSYDILDNGNYLYKIRVNNPLGSIYGYKNLGVYKDQEDVYLKNANGTYIYDLKGNKISMLLPRSYKSNNEVTVTTFSPGDSKYQDIDKNGIIDSSDIVYLGNTNPLLYGGFQNSFTYKRITLNIYFTYKYGNSIVNKARMLSENMYNFDNQSSAVMRRWRKSGDETDIPRALIGKGSNWLASDKYVEDGSFLKLQNIQIRYNLPTTFVQKLKLNSVGIYANAQNLLTFTKYKGLSPEVGYSYDPNLKAFQAVEDLSQTPLNIISYSFGIDVTF